MSKVKGSCLCGSGRYESNAEPLMIATCHCSHCRKQSGSAFSVNVGVPKDTVTLTGDSLREYEDKGTASGIPSCANFARPVGRRFCQNSLQRAG